jgi:2-dehydro-3-deoxygluconokinase
MSVLSFGELLLRLSAPGYNKLFQRDTFEWTFCGGEANVAVSLANFGVDSKYITKLPDNDIGQAAANTLRFFGVDTSKVIYSSGRMGLYYLEKGASQRPSQIIYDRSFSAMALAKKSDFNWDSIFEGVTWFHWTGITPALGDGISGILLDACKIARRKNITVSCDLNYRKSLWSCEKAQSVMHELMSYVDVCIANEEDAEKMLGIAADHTDVEAGHINKQSYQFVAEEVANRYNCKAVAITLRESYSASRNGWSSLLYDNGNKDFFYSKQYDIQLVDRVGGGDSFAAGVIYGFITNQSCQYIIDFATAASCLKQTMEGDFNRSSVLDVENLLESGGSGRVKR